MDINAKKPVHLVFKATFFCAFLLSDFYYSGAGRIFDYLTVLLLILLLHGVSLSLLSNILILRALPLLIFSSIGIVIGLFSGSIAISMGLIIGILIILPI